MLFPRLLTSCRNSSNHVPTLPTISHLLSSLFNDLHLCAHLDSPQLSVHLSRLNSFQLVLAHLTWVPLYVPLVQFFSARLKWHKCKFSFSAQVTCLSIRSIRLTSLKLRSAYFKETLPSGKLSVFDFLNQSLRHNHRCNFRLSYLWILLDCHLLAQRAPVPMHKVPQHTQTTIGLHHTTIEHIALMHRFQCTKRFNTCKLSTIAQRQQRRAKATWNPQLHCARSSRQIPR